MKIISANLTKSDMKQIKQICKGDLYSGVAEFYREAIHRFTELYKNAIDTMRIELLYEKIVEVRKKTNDLKKKGFTLNLPVIYIITLKEMTKLKLFNSRSEALRIIARIHLKKDIDLIGNLKGILNLNIIPSIPARIQENKVYQKDGILYIIEGEDTVRSYKIVGKKKKRQFLETKEHELESIKLITQGISTN